MNTSASSSRRPTPSLYLPTLLLWTFLYACHVDGGTTVHFQPLRGTVREAAAAVVVVNNEQKSLEQSWSSPLPVQLRAAGPTPVTTAESHEVRREKFSPATAATATTDLAQVNASELNHTKDMDAAVEEAPSSLSHHGLADKIKTPSKISLSEHEKKGKMKEENVGEATDVISFVVEDSSNSSLGGESVKLDQMKARKLDFDPLIREEDDVQAFQFPSVYRDEPGEEEVGGRDHYSPFSHDHHVDHDGGHASSSGANLRRITEPLLRVDSSADEKRDLGTLVTYDQIRRRDQDHVFVAATGKDGQSGSVNPSRSLLSIVNKLNNQGNKFQEQVAEEEEEPVLASPVTGAESSSTWDDNRTRTIGPSANQRQQQEQQQQKQHQYEGKLEQPTVRKDFAVRKYPSLLYPEENESSRKTRISDPAPASSSSSSSAPFLDRVMSSLVDERASSSSSSSADPVRELIHIILQSAMGQFEQDDDDDDDDDDDRRDYDSIKESAARDQLEKDGNKGSSDRVETLEKVGDDVKQKIPVQASSSSSLSSLSSSSALLSLLSEGREGGSKKSGDKDERTSLESNVHGDEHDADEISHRGMTILGPGPTTAVIAAGILIALAVYGRTWRYVIPNEFALESITIPPELLPSSSSQNPLPSPGRNFVQDSFFYPRIYDAVTPNPGFLDQIIYQIEPPPQEDIAAPTAGPLSQTWHRWMRALPPTSSSLSSASSLWQRIFPFYYHSEGK